MKILIVISCVTAVLDVVSSTLCSNEEDCLKAWGNGFCCVGLTLAQLETRGICVRRRRKGEICNTPDAQMEKFGGKYPRTCPCFEGLECQNTRPHITDPARNRLYMRCQLPSETTPGNEGTSQPDIASRETGQPEVTKPPILPETYSPDVQIPDETPDTEIPEIPETLPPEIPNEPETEEPLFPEEPEIPDGSKISDPEILPFNDE